MMATNETSYDVHGCDLHALGLVTAVLNLMFMVIVGECTGQMIFYHIALVQGSKN